jgi:hypothetical protein
LAGQGRVVELVVVTKELVRLEFEIRSAEGEAASGAEIGERHLVGASDPGIEVMGLARESVRWKPFGHCVRVEECPVNSLWRRAQHSVQPNGAGFVRGPGIV